LLLLDIVSGRLPVLVNTWLSVVDVDDCTEAHLLAERDGVPGKRYLVSSASFDVRTAVTLLRRVSGHPRRVWFAPRALASVGGAVAGAMTRALRREGRICHETVRTLLHGHRFDASLAERELGLRYTPIEVTIRRTLAWYSDRGLAPPPIG
jgi:dihydroflavonol-4-reductase